MGLRRSRSLVPVLVISVIVAACSGGSTTAPDQPPDRPNLPAGTTAAATTVPDHHLPPDATPDDGWRPDPTAYSDVEFRDHGVNPFVDSDDDPFSTFAMDVDTASYTVGRRFLLDGHLPDPASVRVEEYVNFFKQGYAPPARDVFAVHVDGASSPFLSDPRNVLLRVGIKARDVEERERRDAALTFVIDVSGSMAQDGRLELAKEALGLLVDRLRPGDSVGVVVYGDDARVLLEPTSAAEPERILSAIGSLRPEGSTNAEAGLRVGYEMARHGLRPRAVNRVVLISDGVANVGETDPEALLDRIERDARDGIQLITVGVGMGNFNDALMERLADGGDGFYAYVDDISEAERIFGERLTSSLETLALDAKIQVEFDPDAVRRYRLIGFEGRDVADEDFRDPNVRAGAIGPGHEVTALYEIEPGEIRGRLGTVRLRWTPPEGGSEERLTLDLPADEFERGIESAAPELYLDAVVAGYAEVLRESPWVRGVQLADIAAEARRMERLVADDPDVEEFVELTERAAELQRQGGE